jgi:hypothetical protein
MADTPVHIPLLGVEQSLSEAERRQVKHTSDALLRASKDLTGNDVRIFVLACMNAVGYAIARSEVVNDLPFQERAFALMPLYVNAYRQDGPGTKFSKDS